MGWFGSSWLTGRSLSLLLIFIILRGPELQGGKWGWGIQSLTGIYPTPQKGDHEKTFCTPIFSTLQPSLETTLRAADKENYWYNFLISPDK